MNLHNLVEQAADLEINESLFIPTATKEIQRKIFYPLRQLAKDYCQFFTDVNLVTVKTFQDGKLWIKITKEPPIDSVFVKTLSGEVVKTKVE